jgi:hypothetical protein
MRAAVLITLALLPVLADCGAKGDLIIGELEPIKAGSGSMTPAAGVGASGGNYLDQGGATSGSSTGGDGGTDAPGAGAAGASDAGAAGAADNCVDGEQPPTNSLLHRYSFDGTGTTVIDSIGKANGTVQGGALLDGSGVLTLPGERDGLPDQYVGLADGLVSSLGEVSIVVWTTWLGGAGYQRVFDFGVSDLGAGQGNAGKSYLAVMPSTGFANGTGLGAEIAAPGYPTLSLGSVEMMENRPAVVGFTLRSGTDVALYLDGKLLLRSPTQLKLSDIKDVNDFVGQSQWSKDHCYHGTFSELRIYNVALDACQLRTLWSRGADQP